MLNYCKRIKYFPSGKTSQKPTKKSINTFLPAVMYVTLGYNT